MADRQHDSPRRGGRDQGVRLAEVRGDRLLHEDVNAGLDQAAGYLQVIDRRHRDHRDVDASQDLADSARDRGAVLAGRGLGPRRVDVDHDDRLRPQQTGQQAHVVASHDARADHGGPNRSIPLGDSRAQGRPPHRRITNRRRGRRAAPRG